MYPRKKISEICEILDRLRKPVTASDRISGPYPYYGATGIQDYVDKYIFDEDLILVGEDGAKWGKGENTAFKIRGKTWVNNHAHVLRLDQKQIEENWIIYFLNYSDLSPYISGATVKKLNQDRLRSIEIPLPPLPTQQKIVAKLDEAFANIDSQIALIQSNIEDVEKMRESVLESIFNDSSIPKKTIQEIFKIKSGNFLPKSNMKESGKYDVYGGNGINGKHDQYNLDGENIIIGRVGALCGNVRLVEGKFWLTDNAFYVSEYLVDNINKSYLKNILEFLRLGETANKAAQPVISYKSISSILIPLPTLHRQHEIVTHLDRVFAEIVSLQSEYRAQISVLEKLKQSLLQDAFEGKLIIE